jgi:biopolymer transport protein ExbD
MADIAFLMIIFFLVVATIDQDQGILIKLPPYSPNDPVELDESRVLSVKVNSHDEILLEGSKENLNEVHSATFEFLNKRFSQGIQPVISIQTDRGTSYNQYLNVYNEILIGYNVLWNQEAQLIYNTSYLTLTKSKESEIRKKFPFIISEADPSNYGE